MAELEGSALKRARTSHEDIVSDAVFNVSACPGDKDTQPQLSLGNNEREGSGAGSRGSNEKSTEPQLSTVNASGADDDWSGSGQKGVEEALSPAAGILRKLLHWALEPNSAANALLVQAKTDLVNIRKFLRGQAAELAGRCGVPQPCKHAVLLPDWDPKNPNLHTTCGVQQQAHPIANVSIEVRCMLVG